LAKGFQDSRYRKLIGKLVDERRRQGQSQESLAQLLGQHQQFVSRYETGERRLDVVEFADIAKALSLSAAVLLEELDTQ
jgi:transcriptional regulator with XRE-family HTH domain